jgi:hypothetical protein
LRLKQPAKKRPDFEGFGRAARIGSKALAASQLAAE